MLLTGYSLYLFIPAGCTEQLLLLRISQSAGPAGSFGSVGTLEGTLFLHTGDWSIGAGVGGILFLFV